MSVSLHFTTYFPNVSYVNSSKRLRKEDSSNEGKKKQQQQQQQFYCINSKNRIRTIL